jgi:hypothetical protein
MRHPGYLGSPAHFSSALREAYRRGIEDCIKILDSPLLREEGVSTAALADIVKQMSTLRLGS